VIANLLEVSIFGAKNNSRKNTTHPGLTVIFCNDPFDLFAEHVQNRIKNNPTCFTLYHPRLVQQGFRDGGTPRKTIIRLHIF
jgi:hypothetical protein